MKTLITGASGFLGTHLSELITADTNRYQLTTIGEPLRACKDVDRVYHLAANVGGIQYLKEFRRRVVMDNAMMGLNILEASYRKGVKEFYNIASVCMYPDIMLKEGNVDFGLPFGDTRGYGLAKRFVMNVANMYSSDEFKVVNLILTNLYGEGDKSSHVVADLVRKIISAERNGDKSVEVLGKKDTTRDLLYVKDCANIIAEMPSNVGTVNIATGEEVSIGLLINVICDAAGYKGNIIYTGEDIGQKRRKIDVRKMKSLGFNPQTSLEEGIYKTVEWAKGETDG
jgi:GDP-L-fucose synthase